MMKLAKKAVLVPAVVLAARVACADQVARDQVTLGKLADSVDRIVVAKVLTGAEGRVRLQVEQALKGPGTEIDAKAVGEVRLAAGERGLFFLRETKDGVLGPASEWHRVKVANDAEVKALVESTCLRLPRIGGEADALRKGLLKELSSPVTRIREDACLDLLNMRKLVIDDAAREAVATALGAAVESGKLMPELLALAAKAPSPAIVGPAVTAALGAKDDATLDWAAVAVKNAKGRDEAAPMLMESLADPDDARAASAARLLGRLGGEGVVDALARQLETDRAALRRAAIEALGRTGDAKAVAVLAGVVEKPRAIEDGRLALASLTLSGLADSGKVVAKAARTNPDGRLRRLAARLAQDPVQTARLLVVDPARDPSERDETPALEEAK